jgi:hypothetical protein
VVHAAPSRKFLHKVQEQGLVHAFQEDVHVEHQVKDECNLDGNQWRNRVCCLQDIGTGNPDLADKANTIFL